MEIGPEQLADKLRRGDRVWLLDVRHGWEHQLAKLPGETVIPLHELPARLEEVHPPEGAEIVCYCHHGVRSLSAAVILREAGYGNALSLRGGIDLWSRVIDPSVARY